MTTFYQTSSEKSFIFDSIAPEIEKKCRHSLGRVKRTLNSYFLFHFSFAFLLLLQSVLFVFLVTFKPTSFYLATSLALLFLTTFSYIILIYYLNQKKREEYIDVISEFHNGTKKIIPQDTDISEFHLSVAASTFQLTTYLHQKETYLFSLPPFKFCKSSLTKICLALHHKDLLFIQESLIKLSLDHHKILIIDLPTDLALHTSFANTFIALSKIYVKPDDPHFKESKWIDSIYSKESIVQKFKNATQKAIEELNILDEIAPQDPWTHAQLANCYHHLSMKNEEIKEYEILQRILPKDKKVLFRLGFLYFQNTNNAKGLKIYSLLKEIDPALSRELLLHYI